MIPIAKGKFSQPRQPRREQDDLYTAFQRPEPREASRENRTGNVADTARAETIVVKDGLFPTGVIPPQPDVPRETPSFEEEQFLNETAADPSADAGTGSDASEEYGYGEDSAYARAEAKRLRSRNKKILLISICAVSVLLLAAIITGVVMYLNASADDGLILNNVTIAGVNVGGMTPEQAASAVHRATDLTYTNENMVIYLPDMILELSPADTGVKLDVDAAVQAAYDYGRSGTREENRKAREASQISSHTIALLPYLNLDTVYVRQVLDEYGEGFNSTYEASSYKLEGEKPPLEGEKFDENAVCQTLILNPGSPGRNLDINKIYNAVLDAYSLNEFEVRAELSAPEEIPQALDLDAIFAEYHCEPVDASMNMETFEVTGEIYGYTFNLDKARQLLAETPYGTTIGIPMEYIIPSVRSEDLDGKLFRDVLASCETPHTNDSNRNNNLKLACAAINGYILNPGDTFDYNDVLGERTEEAGYKSAGALNAGTSIKEVGGGICQVSSTLYYCTLVADLEIVSRRSHSLVSTYIPMGMDATVSWGGPEFRFKNNTDYPIRIDAEVSGGHVKISLVGTDERDYYVEMESKIVEVLEPKTEYKEYSSREDAKAAGYTDGEIIQQPVTGYTVYTYKCKYNKDTGKLISKDYEATSNYVRMNKIVVRVNAPETKPPETTVAPEPTVVPTAPPAADPPADTGSEPVAPDNTDAAA